ncbi:hypothetical protein FISHEDRAFT_75372 [Fistulina hepatica ATCC 64428]|uniref:Uncharacterized protein n=1 Tax=Fistulina hepatica ATCC 64428 TaxID=1128425 RepID=A0A0D7A771_9AGAR|nr:hypothetical protein FISHEDRAFT_75372 [Fistulina hepatica ATCC 64428]
MSTAKYDISLPSVDRVICSKVQRLCSKQRLVIKLQEISLCFQRCERYQTRLPTIQTAARPSDYEPFDLPFVHTTALVTAYSESVEGWRTTLDSLDSLATLDYPNLHKMILVIADDTVKGSGNDMTTPEIVLNMMRTSSRHCRTSIRILTLPLQTRTITTWRRVPVHACFYSYDDPKGRSTTR